MDIIVLVAVALLRLVGLTLDQLQEGVERLETAFVHQYAAQEAARTPVEVAVIERLERPTPD